MNEIFENATPNKMSRMQWLNYIDNDGNLVRNATIDVAMIRSEEDRFDLSQRLNIGSVVITPGQTSRWQLNAAREWEYFELPIFTFPV